jgi:Calcineurin-like phosphoesterase
VKRNPPCQGPVVSIAKQNRLDSVADMHDHPFRKFLRFSPACVLGLVLTLVGAGYSSAREQTSHTRVEVDSAAKPWSNLSFNNDPNHFQFVVVSDRTGGARPGVFEDGVRKINLLQPEFVMSVGDLIQGGTSDRQIINAQWAEFQSFVKRLQMPFFYVPGNHDISNKVMAQEWVRRFGKPYYHFVYRDVLFLCLDTEDPPPTHMSAAQRDYVAHALAENPSARWTLVFMHKPLWDYDEDTGWREIEALLKGRKYTIFAGHRHSYTKFERNDRSCIVLATTGASSKLRGRAFGEFDQVAWVTMTDHGPILANLYLDGIWDENVRTEGMEQAMRGALEGKAVSFERMFTNAMFRGSATFPGATTQLRLVNNADLPMKFSARLHSTDQVHVIPAQVERVLPPRTTASVEVRMEIPHPTKVSDLSLLSADWSIVYEFPKVPPVEITGKHVF